MIPESITKVADGFNVPQDQTHLIGLIRQLCYDDGRPLLQVLFKVHFGTDSDTPAPMQVCILYTITHDNLSTCWEIRSRDVAHQCRHRYIRVMDQSFQSIDYFSHIVRWDFSCDADGDAA